MKRESFTFGHYVRETRERLRQDEADFSLRKVANRIGIQASYLSRVEREKEPPPSEETIIRLADDLGIDPDLLLALAGKVSSDLQEAIRKRPQLFGQLIRELTEMPDHAVLRLVREVRDGDW
jgi:HTH-type transcriptional regulator, competence development regulator